MRGDLATRWTAHVAAVNAGIKTVDEVRACENLNTRGGDADELRQPQNITGKPGVAEAPSAAEPPPTRPVPSPVRRTPSPADEDESARARRIDVADAEAQVRAIVTESAARLIRKEQRAAEDAAIRYASDPAAFRAWAAVFYGSHRALVAQAMQVDAGAAQLYCDSQRDELVRLGLQAALAWTPEYLVGLALDVPHVPRSKRVRFGRNADGDIVDAVVETV